MSDELRHLAGCPEDPLVEHYTAGRRHVTRCVSCGGQVVGGPAPAGVPDRFDPEANPAHPGAGVGFRSLARGDLARRAYAALDVSPYP